jgi:hypothetical protein
MSQGSVQIVAGANEFVINGTSSAAATNGVEKFFQSLHITRAKRGGVTCQIAAVLRVPQIAVCRNI